MSRGPDLVGIQHPMQQRQRQQRRTGQSRHHMQRRDRPGVGRKHPTRRCYRRLRLGDMHDAFRENEMGPEFVGRPGQHRVPGRGLPRIRYIADVEDIEKRSEALTLEVVPWDKFIMGPGRSWDKVPWIAFPLDLTFDEMEKLGVDPEHLERIGVGLSSPLEDEDGGDNDEDDDAQKGI